MDLDTLRFGNFAALDIAIADWARVVKHLQTLKKDAREGLKGAADRANWNGVNATVTREFITKTAGEFSDAHTEASSIYNILKDARDELLGYRKQLNDAISAALKKNLTVRDNGDGAFTVTMNVHPDRASEGNAVPAHSQQDVDHLRDEVQRILRAATESDDTADRVLRALVDQAEYGFSGASYQDRDAAADAVEAADQLAKMAKKPADMSLDEIAAFNRVMAKYHTDPLFAEQFATRLGPKGTLQFWTEMTYAHAGAKGSEIETMKEMQGNLSLTLATASLSDSDAMKAWKGDLIAESNTNFRPQGSPNPIGALGSQVISSLLRQGRFDTEFLGNYREKLFKADKGAGESSTDDLWIKGYDGLDLVFGDGDGRDPLKGLFDGLSHNPEAAVHAFESRPDLDHMLGTTRYTDRGESLGRALQAAVTGLANGENASVAPPHSAAQVKIMANIMNAVAQPGGGVGQLMGGADLVKTGLGDSFGNMAAAYMPEISQKLNDESGYIFLTHSANSDGLGGVPDVVRFLSAVSEDPAGRAGIILGESNYTTGLIEAHFADPSLFDGPDKQVLEAIGKNAGLIEGIVAHSVADGEVRESVKEEARYNESLKAKGDYAKTWITTGMTFLKVPAQYGGDAMGAVIGGGMGAVASAAIDHLINGQKMDGARDESLYRSAGDLYDSRHSVVQQTRWAAQEAVTRYHRDLPEQSAETLLTDAVHKGWDASSEFLNRTKARP